MLRKTITAPSLDRAETCIGFAAQIGMVAWIEAEED
jgi:hypothetical protein